MVYRHVAITNTDLVLLDVEPGTSGYAILNGLQLVPSDALSPEPPTLYRLLDINIGAGPQKTGFAAVGIATNDFWNWYNDAFWQQTSGALFPLALVDGTPTQSGLIISNAPGFWGWEGGGDPMYISYVYPGNWGHATLTVTNLPTSGLPADFYIYAHAGAADANSVITLTSGGVTYGPRGTTIWGDSWSTANWEEGAQYIVFRNVPIAANQPVSIDIAPGANGYAQINGLQIAVPLDRDGNGLPDWWEIQYFGHTGVLPGDDPDHDGLSNAEEYHIGTDPTNADTGNTGVPDGQKDSDGDGLSNLAELRKYHSDPANAHTFNSLRNDAEYLFTAGLDDPTTMADLALQNLGSSRWRVIITGGFPNDSYDLYYTSDVSVQRWQWRALYCGIPTDAKGQATFDFTQPDAVAGFFIILEASDDDSDGLSNSYESWVTYQNGTKMTSPTSADTDGDCMNDGWEVEYGLDPTSSTGDNGGAGNPDTYQGMTDLDNVDEHNSYYSQPLGACFHPQGVTTWNAAYDPLKNYNNQASRTVVTISCYYNNDPPPLGTEQRTAHFVISRATYHPSGVPDPMADPLTVYYALGGSLRYNVDYTVSPVPPASPPDGTPRIFIATIGANSSSTTIDVTVNANVVPAGQVGTIAAAITPWAVAANPPPATGEYVVDWRNNRTRLSFAASVTRNVPSLAPSPIVYTTILDAYNACSAGDTVLVEDGVYQENLLLENTAGAPGSPITLRSVRIGGAVIDPNNNGGNGINECINIYNADYHVIQGFEIRNGPRGGISIYSSHNQILNNEIHHNGSVDSLTDNGQDGIYSGVGTSGNSYIGNYVHANGRFPLSGRSHFDHGLYLSGANETVANNIIYSNAGSGIQISGDTGVAGPTKIYNNTIVSNVVSCGITLYLALDGIDIQNNILDGNARFGIRACQASNGGSNRGVYIDYNLIYENGLGPINMNDSDCPTSSVSYNNSMPHDLTTSPPLFVNAPFDWHLQSGSAAIDSGASLTAVTTDYEGNPRPTPNDPSQAYDIGAYQHQSN